MASNDKHEPVKWKITLPGLSQLSSFVGTDHIVTDDEVSEINALLVPPMKTLRSLEDEIDKINQILKNLCQQHASLSEEINTVRTIIAPIRRIPTDILIEIFHRCLPTEHNVWMNKRQCPLLLTHVCRNWRKVTIATPSLWASVHILIPELPVDYRYGPYVITEHKGQVAEAVERRAIRVQEWLTKSGACPLSISLSEDDVGDFPRPDSIIPVFISSSSRWKNLVVVAPPDRLSRLAAVSDVPLLESLTLVQESAPRLGNYAEANSNIEWERSALLKAPKLKKVSFERLWGTPPPLPLRWSQLTSFTFKENSSGFSSDERSPVLDVARMLQPCVHLANLHLELSLRFIEMQPLSNETEELRDPFVLSLPLLECLFILDGGGDARRTTIFFDILQAPSLISLEINTSPPLSFFSHHANIRDLHLHLDQFAQENFIQLLRHCPQVTSLVTSRSPKPWSLDEFLQAHIFIFDDNTLKLFMSPSGSDGSYLCPKLEDLECRSCAGFSDDGLVEFITLKRNDSLPDVAKIKRLHVEFDRPQTSWTEKQSQGFVEDLLKVAHLNSGIRDNSYGYTQMKMENISALGWNNCTDGSAPNVAKLKRAEITFNRMLMVDVVKTKDFREGGLDLQLSYAEGFQ
ncbi:unnamed protein product [Cyclocybe aegerita]|uniref:F-box domain-containing protein n=1 Tax=Cyclocybe aegerita TaxID=1973307 RepID=A0A8S0XZB1_CYCAE|nr:unnamed protein product [Cyclocybe aegerita]